MLDNIVSDLVFETNEVQSTWGELSHTFISLGVLLMVLHLIFRKKEL